jgi:hypothetical protein
MGPPGLAPSHDGAGELLFSICLGEGKPSSERCSGMLLVRSAESPDPTARTFSVRPGEY